MRAYPLLTNQVLYKSRVPLSRHWRLYLPNRCLSFSSSGMVYNSRSVRSLNPFLKSTTKGMVPPRWECLGRGRRWCLRRRLRRPDAIPASDAGQGGCFYKTTHHEEVGTREKARGGGLLPDQSGYFRTLQGHGDAITARDVEGIKKSGVVEASFSIMAACTGRTPRGEDGGLGGSNDCRLVADGDGPGHADRPDSVRAHRESRCLDVPVAGS